MPGPNWSRLIKGAQKATQKAKKFTSFEEWRAAEGAANDEALQILKQREADEAFRLMQEAQQAALERQIAQGQYQQRADMIRDAADEIRFGKTGKQHLITRKSSKPSVTGTQTIIEPKTIKMPESKVLSDSDMELLRYKIDLYDGANGDEDVIEMFKAMDQTPSLFIPGSPQAKIELPYRTGWKLVNGKLLPISFNGRPMSFAKDAFEYGPNSSFRRVQPLFNSARDFYHLSDGIKSRPEVKVPNIKSNGVTINRGAAGLAYSQTTNDMLGQYLAGIKSMIDGTSLYQREVPSLYPTKELETAATTVKSPYITPITTVKSQYFAPRVTLMENPEYLAQQAAFKDMNDAGIKIDARLSHPEWFIPFGEVVRPNNSGIDFSSASGHYSTQGFTTRGHMFGEDLESGLGDLRIIMGASVDPRKPKVSRDWYPTKPGSREDEIVRFIGVNPNKTGMWKQGGVLSAKSGIHIKKKNRGKFTSWCGGKVTSECIARGKRSSNPAIRKRATFAANARRWHHKNGGIIMPNWAFKMLNRDAR